MAKILIIDDDKMVRDTLRMLLTAAGHHIIVANDGKQGLKAFAEIQPDLVITDILMPEKEGVETIGDIRKISKVPIIAMSGGGRVGNMSFLTVAQQFGANRTFAKPFQIDELLNAVKELLKAA
jgi:two-component system, chemotaxis family, chemotaxis protein CheY